MKKIYILVLLILFCSSTLANETKIKSLLSAQHQVELMTLTLKAGIIHQCKQTGRTQEQCTKEIGARKFKNVETILQKSYQDTYTEPEIGDMLQFYESKAGQKRALNDLLYIKKTYGMSNGDSYLPLTPTDEEEFNEFKSTPGGKKVTQHSAEFQSNVKKYLHLLEQE